MILTWTNNALLETAYSVSTAIPCQHPFCCCWRQLFFSFNTILCPHCSTHRLSLATSTGSTVKQTQQSTVKLPASQWLTPLHLALVGTWMWKTTSWNYLSAHSYSVFIVLASCSRCCQAPWLPLALLCSPLAATPLLATIACHLPAALSLSCWWCRPGSSTISSSRTFCLSSLHFLSSALWQQL